MAAANEPAPIIIKKIKKAHHEAHHGGAWKVAYADFVTAMMAFFLLLWLLNVTTDEQKHGIADYFSPTTSTDRQSGSGGVLQGTSFSDADAQIGDAASLSVSMSADRPEETAEEEETPAEEQQSVAVPVAVEEEAEAEVDGAAAPSEEDVAKLKAQKEEEQFRQAEYQLRQALQDVPDLADLAQNLVIDRTPEGLRIQLVDQENLSMFPLGSAEMAAHTQKLMQLVAEVVTRLPNRVAISGHTDSTPYAGDNPTYTNWELSSDRANASRRALVDNGVAAQRIASVIGKAEHEPFIAEDAADARNRRISIVLLREAPQPEKF